MLRYDCGKSDKYEDESGSTYNLTEGEKKGQWREKQGADPEEKGHGGAGGTEEIERANYNTEEGGKEK